jgi:fatty acid desaturase
MDDVMGHELDGGGTPARGINRAAMLAACSISDFSGRTPGYTIGIIALDLLLIIVAAALCVAFWSPATYVVTAMFIGARQVGVATIVLHDGVHGLLLKNRRHNDLFAKAIGWLVLVPTVVDFDEFRKTHLGHHRKTNAKDDPDRMLMDVVYGTSAARLVCNLLLCFIGVIAARYLLAYVQASWQRKAGVLAAITGFALGLWFEVRWCELLVFYYFLPFYTWGLFINIVRAIVEHYPPGSYGRSPKLAGIALTREVIPSWFDKIFVCTRNLNYHLTHHLFPSVSFRRLSQLQRHLARSAAYQEIAHVTHGYHRALADLLLRNHRSRTATRCTPRAVMTVHDVLVEREI